MKRCVLCILLASTSLIAKDRNWKTAELVRISSSSSGAAVAPVGTMLVGVPLTTTYYWMKTDAVTYVLVFNPMNQWKSPDLVLHGKTKIAVSGKTAYFIQDSGKEAHLPVAEKIATESSTPAP